MNIKAVTSFGSIHDQYPSPYELPPIAKRQTHVVSTDK
jgi:hypothetical protein